MGRLVLVPFMGTSLPTTGTVWDFGLPTVNGVSRVGYFDPNAGFMYYGFHPANPGFVYLSYSQTARVCRVNSSTQATPSDFRMERVIESAGVNIYYTATSGPDSNIAIDESDKFNNFNEIIAAFKALNPPEGSMNIKYSIQNGIVIGPSWISPGGSVTSYITLQAGFTLTQNDISVTRNGMAIPFAYSNGVLTFTAPS